MALGASHVSALASLQGFVGSVVVLAIIDSVANLTIRNASEIGTSKFTRSAIFVIAILLIRAISAIILMIALPGAENTPSIAAPKFRGLASVSATVVIILVRVIPTIIIAIARPQPGNALAISTDKLVLRRSQAAAARGCTCIDTLFTIVDRGEAIRAKAKRLSFGTRMTGIRAASVIDLALIDGATLPLWSINLDSAWRVIEPLDNFLEVGPCVFISAINSSKLEVSPVDELLVHGDGEGINRGGNEDLAVRSVDADPLDDLADGVGEVEHVFVVVEGEATRLCQVGIYEFLFQSTGHCRSDDLAGLAETAPVGVEQVAFARMHDDGSRSVHLRDINDLATVRVHGVDGPVPAVGPVDFLVHPIVGNALGVDALGGDVDNGVGGRVHAVHFSDASLASDLREVQCVALVVEIHSHNIGEVVDGLEGIGAVDLAIAVS